MHRLLRFGTTANEHGHWALNRKFKFVAHMRPDHAVMMVLWVFFLHNAARARASTANFKLSDAQRTLCGSLFVRPGFIPFERLAAQHRPPLILPHNRMRSMTMADAAAVMGMWQDAGM